MVAEDLEMNVGVGKVRGIAKVSIYLSMLVVIFAGTALSVPCPNVNAVGLGTLASTGLMCAGAALSVPFSDGASSGFAADACTTFALGMTANYAMNGICNQAINIGQNINSNRYSSYGNNNGYYGNNNGYYGNNNGYYGNNNGYYGNNNGYSSRGNYNGRRGY